MMKMYEYDVEVVNAYSCKEDKFVVLECVLRSGEETHVCKIFENHNEFFQKVVDGDIIEFKGTFALVNFNWRLISIKENK